MVVLRKRFYLATSGVGGSRPIPVGGLAPHFAQRRRRRTKPDATR
jgi:hypothetical protein